MFRTDYCCTQYPVPLEPWMSFFYSFRLFFVLFPTASPVAISCHALFSNLSWVYVINESEVKSNINELVKKQGR